MVAVRSIQCCSRCRDEFESGDCLNICYKWSVIRPQTSKRHKASAPSLFFLLFVEMLPPIPNLLTVSDKVSLGALDALNLLSRTCKQVQQLNKSVWNMNSAILLTTLLESTHSMAPMRTENYMPSSGASYLYETDLSDGKSEIEGWDPKFPPPPSQSEDIGHWI